MADEYLVIYALKQKKGHIRGWLHTTTHTHTRKYTEYVTQTHTHKKMYRLELI